MYMYISSNIFTGFNIASELMQYFLFYHDFFSNILTPTFLYIDAFHLKPHYYKYIQNYN